MTTQTVSRWSKILLLAAMGLFFTLVVLNNIADFNSNYEFVSHTLAMDTTFPGNHGMWRAIHSPAVYVAFYLGIIVWEIASMVLCWWGAIALLRAVNALDHSFQQAKKIGIAALALGMLQWFVAFECIGGEWFLMWQSAKWNGQSAAFRMFVIEGVVLLLLQMREPEADVSLLT